MHSRFGNRSLRVKKEKKAAPWETHGGGGVAGRRTLEDLADAGSTAPAGPLATPTGAGGGAGLATRLGLALLRALALLRPAAAVLELLARALRLIATAVAARGRTERQRELLSWLRRARGDGCDPDGSGGGGTSSRPESLSAVWRDGGLLCGAVRAAVPSACTAEDTAHAKCDFLHGQRLAAKYLGVMPAFTEAEARAGAAGGGASLNRRLERYLRAVRRAVNRLQFTEHNPAVAWTAASSPDADPREAAAPSGAEGATGSTPQATVARGTGLAAAVLGRRALFTVMLPPPPDDLLIQVDGPCGDFGQQLVRAASLQSVNYDKDDNKEGPRVSKDHEPQRRATFSLKPWFSVMSSKRGCISVETRATPGGVRVSYVPRSAGVHQVSLLRRGRHVAESPYTVVVDVRAGVAAEAPDFTEPWWTADDSGGESRRDNRRMRVVYRVVDFVTEKMLLTNDGKLQKIPPNAPPPLLRALSLPDLLRRSVPTNCDSSESDTETFYDSHSDNYTPGDSPCPSASSNTSYVNDSPMKRGSTPTEAFTRPKRDPEFFRKQCRKVVHMCRFLIHNKPSRRSLEILTTAGRLLDGRPVRLPPEFHTLLARAMAEEDEHLKTQKRLDLLAECVMGKNVLNVASTNVTQNKPTTLDPVVELLPGTVKDINTLESNEETKDIDITERSDGDGAPASLVLSVDELEMNHNNRENEDIPTKLIENDTLAHNIENECTSSIKTETILSECFTTTSTDAAVTAPTDATVTAPTDATVTAPTDATVTAPTDATVTAPTDANKTNDSRGDPAHNLIENIDIRIELEIPVHENVVSDISNDKLTMPSYEQNENEFSGSELFQASVNSMDMSEQILDDIHSSERVTDSSERNTKGAITSTNESFDVNRPDNGINLQETVKQSGAKRPNVLNLSSTFNPHRSSGKTKVDIVGLKNLNEEYQIKKAEEINQIKECHAEISKFSTCDREGSKDTQVKKDIPMAENELFNNTESIDQKKISEDSKTKSNPENVVKNSSFFAEPLIAFNDDQSSVSSHILNKYEKENVTENIKERPIINMNREPLKSNSQVCQEISMDRQVDSNPFPGRPPEQNPSNEGDDKAELFQKEKLNHSSQDTCNSHPIRPQDLDIQEHTDEEFVTPASSPLVCFAPPLQKDGWSSNNQSIRRNQGNATPNVSIRRFPPAPAESPPPVPVPDTAPVSHNVPVRRALRGHAPREPAPSPPRHAPQRSPRDMGVGLDRPPPNLDAVLSAASLEEALARFEDGLQEAANDNGSAHGGSGGSVGRLGDVSPHGAFGGSNGASSGRSWDRGDSDYVSMEDVQSSLHHSPDVLLQGEEAQDDWTRYLTVDYDPEGFGPAEQEIWNAMEQEQGAGDHPISDWVSNLMPSNRYHPRVLSPGSHPMASIREESEDRSATASPSSPTSSPSAMKLSEKRTLQIPNSVSNSPQTFPFLSVTSPSPINMSKNEEETYDSFEWRPQIMTPESEVPVASLIDFDISSTPQVGSNSLNETCNDNAQDRFLTPENDLFHFIISSPCEQLEETDSSNTIQTEKANSRDEHSNRKVIEYVDLLEDIDENKQLSNSKISENNQSSILGLLDESFMNNGRYESTDLSSLELLRQFECLENIISEENDNSYVGDNIEGPGISLAPHQNTIPGTIKTTEIAVNDIQEGVTRSNAFPRDQSIKIEINGSDLNKAPQALENESEENVDKYIHGCVKVNSADITCVSTNNERYASTDVPQIFIEDIDILLTPCVSPQFNDSFEQEYNVNEYNDENVATLIEEIRANQTNELDQVNMKENSSSKGRESIKTQEINGKCPLVESEISSDDETEETIKSPASPLKLLSENSSTHISLDSRTINMAMGSPSPNISIESEEHCTVSQWSVEHAADIVPLAIRVTQWKQFWDQKATSQKQKEDFKTAGVQRTIKRGSTHLEYLKCCHSPVSPQRKRQHPSIRIPGIVSKWKKSFESVVDSNKVAKEFLKLRGVKKRKSILQSYNSDPEQIAVFDSNPRICLSQPDVSKIVDFEDDHVNIKEEGEEKHKSEWPESNLVISRKKTFENDEHISQERKAEYFKTIPPRNRTTKVTECLKFWDKLSKGQSCDELARDGYDTGLVVTEEIIIDELPAKIKNTKSGSAAQSAVKRSPVYAFKMNRNTKVNENIKPVPVAEGAVDEHQDTIEQRKIEECTNTTKYIESKQINSNSDDSWIQVDEGTVQNEKITLIASSPAPDEPPSDAPTPPPVAGIAPMAVDPTADAPTANAAAEGAAAPARRLHMVAAEEMWYRAKRIPIEEVDPSSGSEGEDASRSLDSTDQSWSILEEGAESLCDSDGGSVSGSRPAPVIPPPPKITPVVRQRSNREARSRFENAKLFFQSLEQKTGRAGGGRSEGAATRGVWGRRKGRLRGGTDIETSTDDTGSEGGTLRTTRARRRGGTTSRPRGGAQSAPVSDSETVHRLAGERRGSGGMLVPRGLFRDVRGGGAPQRRELLAALAAVDSRPASPYEEVLARDPALAPSPSPPPSPSPLPRAYDAEYPYLPVTDPRHFRPRATLQSFALGGAKIVGFEDL